MFERFRSEARNVVIRAQQEARDLRDPAVGPDHLFLAMLAEETVASRAFATLALDRTAVREDLLAVRPSGPFGIDKGDEEALRAIGIDVAEIQARLEEELGSDSVVPEPPPSRRGLFRRKTSADGSDAAPRGHIPFSPEAKKMLELGLREAIALKHRHIDSGHLLLALLNWIGGRPKDVLAAQGVTADAVRSAVLGVQRQAS